MSGKVTLVGSGPGSIGLLAPRGREAIEAAEVVLYDQLPGEEILATLPKGAELVDCGKHGGDHTLEQDEIEALMIARAKEGKNVVRLKGGDSFLFGRGGEEMESLRAAGIEVAVVPGITSAIAVPEAVGIPVTHRRFASQVTVITGHEDPTKGESALDWRLLGQSRGTIVVLMGVKNLPQIATALVENGRSPKTPVAIIERGMRPDQRVTVGTLDDIAGIARAQSVRPPAVIVIGDVVSLYDGTTLFRP